MLPVWASSDVRLTDVSSLSAAVQVLIGAILGFLGAVSHSLNGKHFDFSQGVNGLEIVPKPHSYCNYSKLQCNSVIPSRDSLGSLGFFQFLRFIVVLPAGLNLPMELCRASPWVGTALVVPSEFGSSRPGGDRCWQHLHHCLAVAGLAWTTSSEYIKNNPFCSFLWQSY